MMPIFNEIKLTKGEKAAGLFASAATALDALVTGIVIDANGGNAALEQKTARGIMERIGVENALALVTVEQIAVTAAFVGGVKLLGHYATKYSDKLPLLKKIRPADLRNSATASAYAWMLYLGVGHTYGAATWFFNFPQAVHSLFTFGLWY